MNAKSVPNINPRTILSIIFFFSGFFLLIEYMSIGMFSIEYIYDDIPK